MKQIGSVNGLSRFDRNPSPREEVLAGLRLNQPFNSGYKESVLAFGAQVPFYSYFSVFNEDQKSGVEKIRKMGAVLSNITGLDFDRCLSHMEQTIELSKSIPTAFSDSAAKIQKALSNMPFDSTGRVIYGVENRITNPAPEGDDSILLTSLQDRIGAEYVKLQGTYAIEVLLQKREAIFEAPSSSSLLNLSENSKSLLSLMASPFFPDELREQLNAETLAKRTKSEIEELRKSVASFGQRIGEQLERAALRYSAERNRIAELCDVSTFDVKVQDPVRIASKGLLSRFAAKGADSIITLLEEKAGVVRKIGRSDPSIG